MPYLSNAPQDPNAAIQFYLEVLKLYPNLAEAYYDLGELLIKTTGDYYSHDTMNLWQQALLLKPDWREVYPEWARIYRELGTSVMVKNDQVFESRAIIAEGLRITDEIAAAHPLGKHGFRILSNINVPQHFGHACLEIDVFIKMGILGWRDNFRGVLLVQGSMANPHLMTAYWSKYIDVVTERNKVLDLLPLQKWLFYDTFYLRTRDGSAAPCEIVAPKVEIEWQAQGRGPLLELSEFDFERGWNALEARGVPRGAWFVCVHAREPGYNNETQFSNPTAYYRNAQISSFQMAIEHIVASGGWVIRMGDPSMTPLPPLPNVIDYARSEMKSDWMDIFLCSQCRFFLGTLSGAINLPSIFGRPCATTNWITFRGLPNYPGDLFIMKNFWSDKEQRYLSWKEASQPPYVCSMDDRLWELGLRMEDNSPEEIRDLAQEMLERTGGSLQYSAEDERLQAKARKIFDSPYSSGSACRAGRDFLRKNQHIIFESEVVAEGAQAAL